MNRPASKQVARREVCLRAVQVQARLVHLEGTGSREALMRRCFVGNTGDCTKAGAVLVFGIRGQQRVAWASVPE